MIYTLYIYIYRKRNPIYNPLYILEYTESSPRTIYKHQKQNSPTKTPTKHPRTRNTS